MPNAKSTQKDQNILNTWMSQFKTKLVKMLRSTLESQTDLSMRVLRMELFSFSRFRVKVEHQLSSWPI